MKKILSSLSVVDFVVVVAILVILAAIIVPSFVPPSGKAANASQHTQQSAPAKARTQSVQ
jgi:type II secretory pathway pseudopilin PulG